MIANTVLPICSVKTVNEMGSDIIRRVASRNSGNRNDRVLNSLQNRLRLFRTGIRLTCKRAEQQCRVESRAGE